MVCPSESDSFTEMLSLPKHLASHKAIISKVMTFLQELFVLIMAAFMAQEASFEPTKVAFQRQFDTEKQY